MRMITCRRQPQHSEWLPCSRPQSRHNASCLDLLQDAHCVVKWREKVRIGRISPSECSKLRKDDKRDDHRSDEASAAHSDFSERRRSSLTGLRNMIHHDSDLRSVGRHHVDDIDGYVVINRKSRYSPPLLTATAASAEAHVRVCGGTCDRRRRGPIPRPKAG